MLRETDILIDWGVIHCTFPAQQEHCIFLLDGVSNHKETLEQPRSFQTMSPPPVKNTCPSFLAATKWREITFIKTQVGCTLIRKKQASGFWTLKLLNSICTLAHFPACTPSGKWVHWKHVLKDCNIWLWKKEGAVKWSREFWFYIYSFLSFSSLYLLYVCW